MTKSSVFPHFHGHAGSTLRLKLQSVYSFYWFLLIELCIPDNRLQSVYSFYWFLLIELCIPNNRIFFLVFDFNGLWRDNDVTILTAN